MAINETATVEVQVNGEQAKNELQSLEKYAASLKDRIADAYAAGDTKKMKELEKELKRTNSQLRTMRTNAVNIDEVMKNLSAASPKELQKTLTAINKELGSGRIKRGSQEWREYQEKLKLVNAEIRKIKAEGVEAESFLSRMNNKLSKWGGMIASVAAALTGVTLAFSKMRRDSHAKEESADNLEALTGLDDQSIAWLTQQAEILSTTMEKSGLRVKQSSQEILDAYTLVGSAKPELLSDKEALNAVTIEAMRLSNAAKMDLKESVDAVTLSMNQYGVSADEAAKYTNVMAAGSKFGSAAVQSITAAIIKSGVSASGAGVSIEQLVGSIETLGEKGIKDEVAGTGLKTFFLRLQTGADETNPKVVGLQTALTNLQRLSTQDILGRFGQEAYTVAQTLIDGADKVDYYTKAVTSTNVAVEQAAINSDNAAAKTAQMKNQLKEAGIELMERLNPSVNLLGSYFTNLVKFMPSLIDFIQKYGLMIVWCSLVILTYMARIKIATTCQTILNTITKTATIITGAYRLASIALNDALAGDCKVLIRFAGQIAKTNIMVKIVTASTMLYRVAVELLAFRLKGAAIAMKGFWAVMESSKGGVLFAIITAAITISYKWNKSLREHYDLQTTLNRLHEKTAELYEEEKKKMEKLWNTIHDSNKSLKDRRIAIVKLQEIMPDYRAQITEEGKVINETTKNLDEMNVALNRNIKLKVLREEMFARYKAIGDLEKSPALKDNSLMGSMAREDVRSKLAEEKSVLEGLKKEYIDLFTVNLKVKTEGGGNGGDKKCPICGKDPCICNTGGLTDEKRNEAIKKLEADFAIAKEKLTALYSIGKIDKQEFDDFVADSEMKLLDSKRKLYSEESKEYNDLLSQKNQMQIKQNQECQQEDIQSIDKRLQEEKRLLLESYLDQKIDKKSFEEGVLQLEYDALKTKKGLYAKGTKENDDYQRQLNEKSEQDRLKRQQEYEDKLKSFRAEYAKKTLQELQEEELDGLDLLYTNKAIKEEEYQIFIKAIKAKYAIKQGEEVGYGKNDEKYNKETSGFVDQAKAKKGNVGNPEAESFFDSMFGNDAKLHAGIIENLKLMEDEGLVSHKQFLDAKAQADSEYADQLSKKMEFAYSTISSVLSAYSSYANACQDVETSKIEQKYEKEIAAAGNNSTKVAKLEAAKEKEIAKIKSKYNKRAMGIEIAQAFAGMAMSAINAYSSAAAIPLIGYILGPIAAATAVATGMLQIATIKKQHQAQESGYFQGGFTGPGTWSEEKGTVHAGEFVANRYAVRNKEILPVLRLIDNAQKNNTIGSLRASDVSTVLDKSVSHTSGANPSATSGDNTITGLELISNSMDRASGIMEQLSSILEGGIESYVTIDGEHGFEKQYNHYKKLKSNKSR